MMALPAWAMTPMIILPTAVDGCLVIHVAGDGAGEFQFSFYRN